MTLYLLFDAGYEHNTLVGIFDTREAADAEKAYCEVNDADFQRRKAADMSAGHGHYYVAEYSLNVSRANILFRFDKHGGVTHRDFFSTLDRPGEVRPYEEPWEDGTCVDAVARTEQEARSLILPIQPA